MIRINIQVAPDLTFLNSLIYEGILYMINESGEASRFDMTRVEFPDEIFKTIFSRLHNDRIDRIDIKTVGKNDNGALSEFLKRIEIESKNISKYKNILQILKNKSGRLDKLKGLEFSLKYRIDTLDNREYVFIGVEEGKKAITAPQIMKMDRYTGYTCLETPYVYRQLTLKTSEYVILIILLGLYSSYLTSIRKPEKGSYYYFLFFSPEELLNILRSGEYSMLDAYYKIRREAEQVLRNVISKYPSNELLLTELMLDVGLIDALLIHNLDKVSLSLFKVAFEKQTYKIYEVIPIELKKERMFISILERYYSPSRSERILRELSKLLSPDEFILERLSKLLRKKGKIEEGDNLLRAVHGLYRFVTLSDPEGWAEFLRELTDAGRKVEKEKYKREYLSALSRLR